MGSHTFIQLLLGLDRYSEALSFIEENELWKDKWAIERCYALYKLGREGEAQRVLQSVQENSMMVDTEDTQRTVDILDAQIVGKCIFVPF